MRKKNKKIKEITLKDVKSFFKDERYRIKKEVSDFISLPGELFANMSPIFVVSTGRAGSELLVKLFNASKVGNVYHEPRPRMVYGSKIAYQFGHDNVDIQKVGFLNARYDLLKKSYLEDMRYVETNNRLSFFMCGLASLFPRAKFIHLIRHPGAFVRSGIRRKYYMGNENDDGRLVPLESDPIYSNWSQLSDIEKVGWLWNTTNDYIELSKKDISPDRYISVRSEHLFNDYKVYHQLCDFIGLEKLDQGKIESLIKKPVNKQKQNDFPKWVHWDGRDKDALMKMTPLGYKYGFWSSDD